MSKLVVVLLFIFQTQSWARTIYLAPGASHYTDRDVIVCSGGSGGGEQKWWCTCFNQNENLGQVYGIWAYDQRNAEEQGIHKCFSEKRRPITSVNCFPQY